MTATLSNATKNIVDEIQENPSLQNYNNQTLPALMKVRDNFLKAPTEVCIERAKYMTEYLKNPRHADQPACIKRAGAIAYYLSNRKAHFCDKNKIVGGTSSKLFGAPVYQELFGIGIWPELETISTRKANPQLLSKEDADTLNYDVYPYWMDRTVLEVARKDFNNPKHLQLMEKMVFFMSGKTTVISHTVPYYEKVLKIGINGIIAEAETHIGHLNDDITDGDQINFYRSMVIVLNGLKEYAYNLSEAAQIAAAKATNDATKSEYEEIARICKKVPAEGATTFREAVNALWLVQVGIHAENVNMAMSPGRLDQVLYPYFKNDVENNSLTVAEAIELSGSLWLKIADNTNLVPETAEKLFGGAGSVPAVTLGGVTKEGTDAVNELTYIMLRATELLNIKDPNVNARYHYDVNTKEYRNRVSEVVLNTKAVPAMYNDVVNVRTLENQGVSTEHARDYGVVGCVELGSCGREYASTSSILMNLTNVITLTLFNGKQPFVTGETQLGPETGDPTTFTTYNEFLTAFNTQLKWLMKQAINLNEQLGVTHQKLIQTPMLSAFFVGPMEKGKDLIFGGGEYNSSGATHIGFADTIDSLNGIQWSVFETGSFTMNQVINAMKTNYKTSNDLLAFLKNQAPKYGVEYPFNEERKNVIANGNADSLVHTLYSYYQSHTNYRGGKYRPAVWTMTNHAGQGKLAGPLPSGRKAHELLSSGITPTSQNTPDLIGALNSVARLNTDQLPGGWALNMKYSPLEGDQEFDDLNEKLATVTEGYFKKGGMQVQFNIQDYATLIDAKKNPEKYPHLVVRVSGYSAYFKDLNEGMMDEIISRSQFNLFTGKQVNLTEEY